MSKEPALVVDRKGLAKKLANRPKAFVFYELLQNAWDEKVTTVRVQAEMLYSRQVCRIFVEDDSPEGFQSLESIYTLFRDSKKADDPEKRGRFELGEKLVAALALRMEVCTTKGTVLIEGDDRTTSKKKRDFGSTVLVDIKLTREEFEEACQQVRQLIPPEGIVTTFNGETLKQRRPVHTFETTLQTIRVDGEGNLSPTQRKTVVNVYEVRQGEKAHIYEMGIPVVETGDLWHYDIQQRVPVNWERNSVPPSYLKTLRVEVLNAMHQGLSAEEATSTWVTDAVEDSRCSSESIKHVVIKRFGQKTVIHDPSDPEGTKIAASQGYTVIPGGSLSKGAWDNVRKAQAVLPAGQVTPSPRPYSPDGDPEKVIDRDRWTPDMWRLGEFAQELFKQLTGEECYTVIVTEPLVGWSANFGKGGFLGYRLCLNYGRLGQRWFARPKRDQEVLDLLLHEFCHHTVHDHLSHEMHEMATRLGARLANLALDHPELFKEPNG